MPQQHRQRVISQLMTIPAALWVAAGLEQAGGYGCGQHLVARRREVQVIPYVVGRVDLPGVGRIADRAVEVEHGVELAAGADPVVDRLAGRLAVPVRVIVGGVAAERSYRRSVDADARGRGP